MSTATTVKLTETQARGLLESMGLTEGAKGPVKRLATKINQINKWGKGREPKDPENVALLANVLAVIEDKGEIEVVADLADQAANAPAAPKAKAPAKGDKSSPKPPAKEEKGEPTKPKAKPKEEKLPAVNAEIRPSNKGTVYQAWAGDKDMAAEDLCKLVKNQVKQTTIKHWLSAWKRGENLPAVAKNGRAKASSKKGDK